VTIHVEHGASPSTEVFVECDVNQREVSGTVSQRRFTLEAEIGDLPLLVLALQEAIRIGVEHGAFPEIRGPKTAKSA
jgi:hypothetical protein